MFKILSRITFLILSFLVSVTVFAQDSLRQEKPQMAGFMRSSGKIYVVVAVLVIILTGLFIYLIQLDRKLSRIEKNNG